MRDFAKAAGHLTWSMSLFGARQLANLFAPASEERPTRSAAEEIESVSRAATERLGPFLDQSYQAGAKLQDEMVDLAFDMWSPRALDPRWWGARTSRLARTSLESMSRVASGTSGDPSGSDEGGWGPMPPWGDEGECG